MRRNGKIGSWNDDKGYGFIASTDGASRVFVHISSFRNRNRRPKVGDDVTYVLTKDDKGRLRASSVVMAGDERPRSRGRVGSSIAKFAAFGFILVVGGSVLATGLPVYVLIAYLAVSVVTFAAYAIDKAAAQSGRWRTSEAALHLLALLGGWPGAMLAQQTLRHKSKKQSFRTVFWVTVLLNCAAFAWIHTSDGRQRMEALWEISRTLVVEIVEGATGSTIDDLISNVPS